MREILFRGKRIDNGEWVQGFIYEHKPPLQCVAPKNQEKSKWYIVQTAFADWNMPRQAEFIEVMPETVGQFTGLTDESDKKIFDGDIIRIESEEDGNGEFLVKWDCEKGCWSFKRLRGIRGTDCPDAIKIIGNRWGNPELLPE